MDYRKASFFRLPRTALLLTLASAVYGAAPPAEQHTQVQMERLEDIEDLAIQDRTNIENRYQTQLSVLLVQRRQRVERLVQTFPLIERILWIELIRARGGQDNRTGGRVGIPTPGFWAGHRAFQREIAESNSFVTLTEVLLEADTSQVLMAFLRNPYHPLSLRRTADKILRQLRPSLQGKTHLDQAKEARLHLVDQWEAFRKECLFAEPTSGAASDAEGDETSLVAIVHSTTHGYGCFLRGSDDLLHRGDHLGDCTISDVAEDRVTLERNGDRWTDSIED